MKDALIKIVSKTKFTHIDERGWKCYSHKLRKWHPAFWLLYIGVKTGIFK